MVVHVCKRFFGMVAQAFRKLASGVRGQPSLSVVPGFLRPIDTEAIARSERLDDKGAEHGRAELPDSKAQQPDAAEQAVIQRVLSEWTWQGGAFLNELRAYASRLAQYSIHSEHARLRLLAQNILARLRAAGVRAPAELGPLKQNYLEAHQEFTAFRARHRIERPVRDRAGRWTAFGLMFVLIAVELVLNGAFFAKGAAGGYLGGIGTAIGISITNVLFAFLLGFGPARWINYRNIFVRLVALLLTIAGVCLILGLHGFTAHFRDATATLVGEQRAFAIAIERLTQAPWRVADFTSIYLFGLGLLCALGAFWKGITFDDPLPGYGPNHRRMVSAREDYSDQHADLFDELEEIKNDAVRQLTDAIAQVPVFPQQAENIRTQRAALLASFGAYEMAAEAAANQLLARYRMANRRSRKTVAPAHFDDTWRLPQRIVDSPETKNLTTDAETPPSIGSILADFRKLSEQILTEYEQLSRQFPHPTDMR